MNHHIIKLIDKLDHISISDKRKILLKPLKDYVIMKIKQKMDINLIFICTLNSRRSQFSQLWAKVISDYYGQTINSFSGGIEVTECNKRTIQSLKRIGFEAETREGKNPHHNINYHEKKNPVTLYSKLYNDPPNPKNNFAAILTCTHADLNCPFVYGAEKRISLPYEDPKAYDTIPEERKIYDEISNQIATEMKFVFNFENELIFPN